VNRQPYLTRMLRQMILVAVLLLLMMPISVSAQGKIGNSDSRSNSVFVDEEREFDEESKEFESTRFKEASYSDIIRKLVRPERKQVQTKPSITRQAVDILGRRFYQAMSVSQETMKKQMGNLSETTSDLLSRLSIEATEESFEAWYEAIKTVADDMLGTMKEASRSTDLQASGPVQQADNARLYNNTSVQVTGHKQQEQSRVKAMMEQGFSCSAQNQKNAIVRKETLF